MKPLYPENATRTFKAPSKSDDWCGDLGVIDVAVDLTGKGDMYPAIVSVWQPSIEELALMAAGQPILLWVYGEQLQPMSLTVGDPRLLSMKSEGRG